MCRESYALPRLAQIWAWNLYSLLRNPPFCGRVDAGRTAAVGFSGMAAVSEQQPTCMAAKQGRCKVLPVTL